MRALSLQQYWLYAITDLDKRIENRSWPPPHSVLGKRIALHASARPEWGSREHIIRMSGKLIPKDVPTGAIIGSAIVKGFTKASPDKWFFGPYGWYLREVHKLDEPIPIKGMLGCWTVPADIAEEIERQVKRDGLGMYVGELDV